jgi:hypothetical protein
MATIYNYNMPTYDVMNDADIMSVARIKQLSIGRMDARGMVSCHILILYESHVQEVLNLCSMGHTMAFLRRTTSRGDTRVILRPGLVFGISTFTHVGPCYDGEKLTRTQIINDYFARWSGTMREDAFPNEAITVLPREQAA